MYSQDEINIALQEPSHSTPLLSHSLSDGKILRISIICIMHIPNIPHQTISKSTPKTN